MGSKPSDTLTYRRADVTQDLAAFAERRFWETLEHLFPGGQVPESLVSRFSSLCDEVTGAWLASRQRKGH
jgi:hypothetical protein